MSGHQVYREAAAGYTLVELLEVLGILALLATIATPTYMHHLDNNRVRTARIEIVNLGVRLDMFKADIGRYPTTAEGLSALIKAPQSLSAWDGPYVRRSASVDDPWGHRYRYKSPGEHGDYDLFSSGRTSGQSETPVAANW